MNLVPSLFAILYVACQPRLQQATLLEIIKSQAHLVTPIRMKCGPKHYSIHRRMQKAFSQSLGTSSKNLSKQPTFTQQQQKKSLVNQGHVHRYIPEINCIQWENFVAWTIIKVSNHPFINQKKSIKPKLSLSISCILDWGLLICRQRQIKTLGLFCSVCSLTSTSRPYSQIYIHFAE